MRGGRVKLPVLAEISGPTPAPDRVWSLRRGDRTELGKLDDRLEGLRSVAVTGGEDGAEVLAVALAGIAAAAGRRTVLLECDLVRPRLAVDLGLEPAPGLHEYLRWEATAPQVLQPLALAGPESEPEAEPLVCIVAGRPASDPSTLLGLKSFRHMTAKLREAYELVVMLAPAIDADQPTLGAVAGQADGVLAGIAPDQASGRGARRARAALRGLPVAPLGAVVVGLDA